MHVGSRYIHFPDLCALEDFARRRILNLPVLKAKFCAHLHQAVPSIDPTIRKNHRIILDIALGVVRIGKVSCELVQLGGADRTDSGCR